MASPILAMIGAITLAILGIVAIVSLVVIAVRAGLAFGRYVNSVSKAIVNALLD